MSVAEVVVAFGILGILAVVTIGVFTRLLSSSGKGTDQVAAQVVAQTVLDRAVRHGPPNWGFPSGGATGKLELEIREPTTQTDFLYRVEAQRATTTADSLSMGNLYEVQVTVTWWQEEVDSSAYRQGIGRTSLELSRLVFVKE